MIKNIDLLPGDIFLSRSDRLISKIIRFCLCRPKDPAPYSHVAGWVVGGLIESKHKVVKTKLFDYIGSVDNFIVIRKAGLTDEQRELIALLAREKEGLNYGYFKVVILQGLDQILNTNFFTKTFSVTNRPYCSELWAEVYFKVSGYRINGINPVSCEPDDWHDEVEKHPERWMIIYNSEKEE